MKREFHNNYEPLSGFDASQALDLIVYFAARAGGKVNKLKLIKLIYLTEREYASLYGRPSLLDEYYSLPHGPICSSTLNIINKTYLEDDTISVFRLRGKDVVLSVSEHEWDFDYLSAADKTAAERVWAMHGGKSASQLRNYTHANCPEYTHVEHGRAPIPMESLLSSAGVEDALSVAEDVASLRRIEAVYS